MAKENKTKGIKVRVELRNPSELLLLKFLRDIQKNPQEAYRMLALLYLDSSKEKQDKINKLTELLKDMIGGGPTLH